MSKNGVGILGCAALAVAALVCVAVVGFERSLVAAGVPYHVVNFSVAAIALFGVAIACGLAARRTRPGKVALVGGGVLGGLFTGYVVLVLIAFTYPS
jgi:hypothetical protein